MQGPIKSFGERIEEGLSLRKIKAIDLARITGISRGAISSYINGRWKAKQNNVFLIAQALNVNEAWLLGYDVPHDRLSNDFSPSEINNTIFDTDTLNFAKKGVRIPILGQVVAGIPIDAIEDIEGYEEITQEMAATGEFFCLRVKGDSMEPTFKEGDILVIRQQPCVDSNEIAIVIVNGNEGTVKRIKKSEAGITLIGDNTASFLPVFYTNEEIQQLPVKIVGKVVELRRSF